MRPLRRYRRKLGLIRRLGGAKIFFILGVDKAAQHRQNAKMRLNVVGGSVPDTQISRLGSAGSLPAMTGYMGIFAGFIVRKPSAWSEARLKMPTTRLAVAKFSRSPKGRAGSSRPTDMDVDIFGNDTVTIVRVAVQWHKQTC